MYPHQLQVHLVPLALIPIPSGTFIAGLTFWHKEMVGASKSHQKPRLRQRSNQLSLVTCLIQWVVEEGKKGTTQLCFIANLFSQETSYLALLIPGH